MKSLDTSDGVEGQLDKYRRTPGPVELEDGGGAVMAAIEVDDGVNDGPDPSVLVDHIATADLRDVDRFETHAKGKRAERCEEGNSKHTPGAGVALARPVPAQMWHCAASPRADVALTRPVQNCEGRRCSVRECCKSLSDGIRKRALLSSKAF